MKRTLIALLILAALAAAFLGYIGYFGGRLFTEVPARAPSHGVAAVLLSGDMGFKVGMGPPVADRLAKDGIPVIGVSSLVYYRTRRTPSETETLIAEAMRRALATPGTERLVLIGQSFGADMLQTGLATLPPDLRDKVAMVVLIVPGDTVSFRASPSELFNLGPADGPALPTARKLDWVPVVCIHGEEEDNSLCPLLAMPNVRQIALPGGHMLERNPDRLAATVAEAIAP